MALELPSDQFAELLRELVGIEDQLDKLWIGLVLMCIGLGVGIVVMVIAAWWSVRTVVKRQDELEGKFKLLIEVLLTGEERRRAEAAEIHAIRLAYGTEAPPSVHQRP